MQSHELANKFNNDEVTPHSDGSLRLSVQPLDEETEEPGEETEYKHSGKGRMDYVDGFRGRQFIWKDGTAEAFFDETTLEWWGIDSEEEPDLDDGPEPRRFEP